MDSSGLKERVIGVMTEGDLQRVIVEWVEKEGWNPGLHDFIPFRVADPDGFFLAKNENGDPVASVSAVRYGESYGFIGLYICVPESRGKGHGLAVFRHAMAYLEGRVIGLDAVVAQQTNYAKHGFVVAHDTIRFGGEVAMDSTHSTTATPAADKDGSAHHPGGLVVQAVTNDEAVQSLVVDFDRRHVPAPRPEFTRAWLTTPGHITRVAIKDGVVEGYGVMRPSSDGMRIGPLFATSVEVAELLVRTLVGTSTSSATSEAVKTKVFLDVPEPNSEGVQLAERLGLRIVFTMGRMYRGPEPSLPLDRVFAITCAELG